MILDRMLAYCDDIEFGFINSCKWAKLAVARFRRDLDRQNDDDFAFVFDEEKANRAIKFCQMFPHIKGPLASQKLGFEPWQLFIVGNLFGWVRKETGYRRFRQAYTEVARGNGKTAMTAPIGLYGLTADNEGGAEIYTAASGREQATLLWGTAKEMTRKCPEFMKKFGVEPMAHRIIQDESSSYFRAVASDAAAIDGFNVHMALVDELHAHKTRDVYDALETGLGKRPQSMIWSITTAGTNLSGICYEVHSYVKQVLEQVHEDDAFFGIIYTLDEGDDWTDEKNWVKSNPNWEVSVEPNMLKSLCQKAMQTPQAQNNFKTKHLNVWCNADNAWMDLEKYDLCMQTEKTLDDFEGQPCFIGLDLSSKVDVTAKVYLFPVEEGNELVYYSFEKYYLPEAAILESRNSQYSGWEIDGWMEKTFGDMIDASYIRDSIVEDCEKYDVRDIAYDPWQATQMALELDARGLPVIEVRATVANFSEPMKDIDAMIRSQKWRHNGNPVTKWMFSNVVCKYDAKDNIYPRKLKNEQKIDGPVAAIMALARANHHREEGAVYTADRGFLII